MVTGIGHTVAMMAMSMLDHLQPVDGMGPVGEVRIMPDPTTFVPLPYAPGAGAMLADQVQPGGEPWAGCARTYLKQAIAELAAEGYAATAAFEPEFTLGRREPGPAGGPDRLVPNNDRLCYSATRFPPTPHHTIDPLGPPTPPSCTGSPGGPPLPPGGGGRPSPPSRSPIRRATARTCTSPCVTWMP